MNRKLAVAKRLLILTNSLSSDLLCAFYASIMLLVSFSVCIRRNPDFSLFNYSYSPSQTETLTHSPISIGLLACFINSSIQAYFLFIFWKILITFWAFVYLFIYHFLWQIDIFGNYWFLSLYWISAGSMLLPTFSWQIDSIWNYWYLSCTGPL